jgi:hypothetical protein
VKIDLKPITLLFGPNSAGKSTIIQALHYAWEVIGRHNLDPNFTEFGGREIDLGGFQNLVYGHDLSRSVSIRMDMDLKGKPLPIYIDPEVLKWDQSDMVDDWEIMTDGVVPVLRWNVGRKEITSAWVEFKVSWCEAASKFHVSSYEVGLNEDIIAKMKVRLDGPNTVIDFINFFHPLLVMQSNDCLEYCDWLHDLISSSAENLNFSISRKATPFCDSYVFNDAAKQVRDVVTLEKDLAPYLDETDQTYKFSSAKTNESKNGALEEMSDTELRQKLSAYGHKDTDGWPREAIIKLLEIIQQTEEIEKYNEKITQYNEKTDQYEEKIKLLSFYEFLFVSIEAFGIDSINEALDVECLGLTDALPRAEKPFQLSLTSKGANGLLEKVDYSDALDSAIKQFTIGPLDILRGELEKLVYLGPIRNRIPRNYVPNRYIEKRDWPDGLAAWDVLHKEDENFVQKVDYWISKRLNSGYSITRKSYKEIDIVQPDIDQGAISKLYHLAPIKTRLYLIDEKSGVEVQAPDVGVGISQVIPVLVSALYFDSGIISIEQPELHIHPAFQVTLGDLFISQVQSNNPIFILETHSEHMLLRLLRRIRETHDNKLPEGMAGFFKDQLRIYYVTSGSDGVEISTLEVDETGEFKDEWPHGFFEEREEELFY